MERLAMSMRERKRLEVLSRVKRGELALVNAAALLQLTACPEIIRRFGRTASGFFPR